MNNINWRRKSIRFKFGVILMLSSLLFFGFLIFIPIMNISKAYKITFTSISFILAEVLFYTGGFFVGKEVFNKYKAWFNPKYWFKTKKNNNSGILEDIDVDNQGK